MKQWISICILMCLAFSSLLGQNQSANDPEIIKVELKRGITLKGVLVGASPGNYYLLRSTDGDTTRIPHRLVRAFVYEDSPQHVAKRMTREYEFKDRGFYHTASAGLLINTVSRENGGLTGIALSAVFGYQRNRLVGFGIGSGVDFYYPRGEELIAPIFAEVRGYFLERNITPYYCIRGGYGIGIKQEKVGITGVQGGWMMNPAIGWRLSGRGGANLTLDIGVKFQKAAFTYRSNSERSEVDLLYRRLNVRLALLI